MIIFSQLHFKRILNDLRRSTVWLTILKCFSYFFSPVRTSCYPKFYHELEIFYHQRNYYSIGWVKRINILRGVCLSQFHDNYKLLFTSALWWMSLHFLKLFFTIRKIFPFCFKYKTRFQKPKFQVKLPATSSNGSPVPFIWNRRGSWNDVSSCMVVEGGTQGRKEGECGAKFPKPRLIKAVRV